MDVLNFFQFKFPPFSLNIEEDLFFGATSHRDAIELINYFLKEEAHYLLIYGSTGVGKSHLLRFYFNKYLKGNPSFESYLFYCPPFYKEELEEFLIKKVIKKEPYVLYKKDFFEIFEKYLENLYSQKKSLLLFFDEAQNLYPDALEFLKIFSNFSFNNFKILLSGTQEIYQRLTLPEFSSFYQRFLTLYKLEPLKEREIREYIIFRIQKAEGKVELDEGIYSLIYKYTKGIPREINRLMDRVLLIACSEKTRSITKPIVKKACEELYHYSKFKLPVSILSIKNKIQKEDFLEPLKKELEKKGEVLRQLKTEVHEVKSYFFSLEESLQKLQHHIEKRGEEIKKELLILMEKRFEEYKKEVLSLLKSMEKRIELAEAEAGFLKNQIREIQERLKILEERQKGLYTEILKGKNSLEKI